MAHWEDVHKEIVAEHQRAGQSVLDAFNTIRSRHHARVSELTKRNTITYYSGWQQKHDLTSSAAAMNAAQINDDDINGFMRVLHGMDCSLGLDLIIHTPGGDSSATESIIRYLRSMFGRNIRAVVPHTCMSGGTLMALSCEVIIMGNHSCIGPIDPQMYAGLPATGVLKEFNTACREAKRSEARKFFWKQIIKKYPPTMIGECARAIKWSKDLAKEMLKTNMLNGKSNRYINSVISKLVDYDKVFNHGRPITADKAKAINLEILKLEDQSHYQDLVLTLHHCYVHTFRHTPAVKIIENQNGARYVTPPEPVYSLNTQ